jgi:hypothetical protein
VLYPAPSCQSLSWPQQQHPWPSDTHSQYINWRYVKSPLTISLAPSLTTTKVPFWSTGILSRILQQNLWETCFANKIRRLFQGIHNLKGTDTCFFIAKLLVPTNKRPTYGQIACNFCPQKKEQNRTHLTVGGDQIHYPGNKSTPTINLMTTKLLIDLTISMPGAVFLGINLANFYLNTPLPNFECMQLRLNIGHHPRGNNTRIQPA